MLVNPFKRDTANVLPGYIMKCFIAVVLLSIAPAVFFLEGCRTISIRPAPGTESRVIRFTATGYDSGPRSCGWKRNWLGKSVYAYGPSKGKVKVVGITASGTRAKRGTIAADTAYYPYGTVMYVPGYGYGRVEDIGGAIKGPDRIDLWFSSRQEALQWGRRAVDVKVWLPQVKRQ